MTLVIGRRRLTISFSPGQPERTEDRYPMAYAATDHELARLNTLDLGAVGRIDQDIHRLMRGVGSTR